VSNQVPRSGSEAPRPGSDGQTTLLAFDPSPAQ
jgi:hypothetical protein